MPNWLPIPCSNVLCYAFCTHLYRHSSRLHLHLHLYLYLCIDTVLVCNLCVPESQTKLARLLCVSVRFLHSRYLDYIDDYIDSYEARRANLGSGSGG